MLHNWLRTLVTRNRRQRTAGRRPRSAVRPAVERLEDRRLLSGPQTIFRVTDTADSGTGSFRQAILDANANPGPDFITFNLPGAGLKTITPLSPLPAITDPVIIDGLTQLGYTGSPLIQLDGSQAGAGANGLFITSGGSTVEGLDIHSFSGAGIALETGGGNVLQRDFIGTDPSGTVAQGNGEGVLLVASAGNSIGGPSLKQPTLVSGNATVGVLISAGSTGNTVTSATSIGVNISNTAALPNEWGIEVLNSSANTLDAEATAGNTIDGALISGNSTRNQIDGTFGDFEADIPNPTGVLITTPGNTVGANFISNTNYGLEILGSGATGNLVSGGEYDGNYDGLYIDNAPNTTVKGDATLYGNSNAGLVIFGSGASGTVVQGSFFGTFDGEILPGTQAIGVLINGAPDTTIGGTAAGQGNVIANNTRYGVVIENAGATGNVLEGNLIGNNVVNQVSSAIPNGTGVQILNASGNTIGGTAAGAANAISGNTVDGVLLDGPGATGNLIEGNFIGTNALRTQFLGNRLGIDIQGAAGNTVGDTAAGAGNVIAGNGYGVRVTDGAGDAILSNTMYHNAVAGIALVGTGNDAQAAPVLTSASVSGGQTVITGTLTGVANTAYTLQFFANPLLQSLINVEGFQLLGSATVTTGADGTATFSITLPVQANVGDFVTATATDPNGNTSPFSTQDIQVQ
jgi:hypothetical protein